MFRHRARPETPSLDPSLAERLLDGAPADDLPEPYRPVAELLAAVSRPATPKEPEGGAAAAAAFVAAHDAATRPRVRRTHPAAALALVATLLAASTGTALAASAGALPAPAQAVAHDTLGVVGISVPGIDPRHPVPAVQVKPTPHGPAVAVEPAGDHATTPTAEPPAPDPPARAGVPDGTTTGVSHAAARPIATVDEPAAGDTSGANPAATPQLTQPTVPPATPDGSVDHGDPQSDRSEPGDDGSWHSGRSAGRDQTERGGRTQPH
jgi:hypothetical protein